MWSFMVNFLVSYFIFLLLSRCEEYYLIYLITDTQMKIEE